MIEKFGYNQKPLTDEQWLEIGNHMKTSPYTRLRTLRYIAEAEHQSKRFENIAYLSGVVLFLAFLKFPVVRVQPGFQRVAFSAALTYPFYSYTAGLADRLKLKRIKYAYRKHIVQHGGHRRVTL